MPQLSLLLTCTCSAVIDLFPDESSSTVMSVAVAVGGSLSVTVTVKLQLAVLVAASVTINVTNVSPTGKVDPLTGPTVCTVEAPGQLSVPTGSKETTAPHSPGSLFTLISEQLISGFSVSFTVTVKLQLAVLDPASVTTNVFVVVPIGKIVPLARPAVCTREVEQLSATLGLA